MFLKDYLVKVTGEMNFLLYLPYLLLIAFFDI